MSAHRRKIAIAWPSGQLSASKPTEHAVKAVISWQLQKTMAERGLSKKSMAALMGTSRSQLDRLLDPESDAVKLKSLMRTTRLVGKKIKIDLVDAA